MGLFSKQVPAEPRDPRPEDARKASATGRGSSRDDDADGAAWLKAAESVTSARGDR